MSDITAVEVSLGKGGFAALGLTSYDYTLGDSTETIDYEALALSVAKARAHVIEAEVYPLAEKMTLRNEGLETMGNALALFSEALEAFDSDAEGSDTTTFDMTREMYDFLVFQEIISEATFTLQEGHVTASKSALSGASESAKVAIDSMNNAAQLDITRLESLVSRRDEAYEAAESFRSSISGSRSTLLKGIV